MKLTSLTPLPDKVEPFHRRRERFIPSAAGCYVLTTFEGEVLYVGLAVNLRRRMNDHLDAGENQPDTTGPCCTCSTGWRRRK